MTCCDPKLPGQQIGRALEGVAIINSAVACGCMAARSGLRSARSRRGREGAASTDFSAQTSNIARLHDVTDVVDKPAQTTSY